MSKRRTANQGCNESPPRWAGGRFGRICSQLLQSGLWGAIHVASLDTINRLLSVAASLIDRAASDIRNAKFQPVQENIELMGHALAEVSRFNTGSMRSAPTLLLITSERQANTRRPIACLCN